MDKIISKIWNTDFLFQIFLEYKPYLLIILALVFSRSFHRVFGNLPSYYFVPVWIVVTLLAYFGVIPLDLGYFLFISIFVLIIRFVMAESSSGKPKYGFPDKALTDTKNSRN